MLRLRLAPGFRAEQEYIARLLLGDYLGIPFEIEEGAANTPVACLSDGEKNLFLPQTLFSGNDVSLASPGRLPSPTCLRLNVEREGLPPSAFCGPEIPVIYGRPGERGSWLIREAGSITLTADILGSSFFSLARLEEITTDEKDAHGCFPAVASIAWRESFLTRPIVNEYLELLWLVIERLWPGIQRRARTFKVQVSHDVDRPWAYRDLGFRDRLWSIRDSLRRGILPSLAGSPLLNGALAAARLPHRDPFDTFDWMMDREEAVGVKSAFYFLASQNTPYDARYSIESREIRSLIRRIDSRGHEIGLHASYSAWLGADTIRGELSRLTRVMMEEGVAAPPTGGRQHYLRWQAPQTWRTWEEAGLVYDASVGFNGHPGFRCGTCYEFPVFDAVKREPLKLRERPLMVMDVTLLSPAGMGLTVASARQLLQEIADRVKLFNGTLELLWHNNHFCESPGYRELFEDSLEV